MTNNAFSITTNKLRRLVGLALAQKAKKVRRARRQSSYTRLEEAEMTTSEIRRACTDILCARQGLSWKSENSRPYYDFRWKVERALNPKRLRATLKHWENEERVIAYRHGRFGNGYRWVLRAAINEGERRKRKRKEWAAKQAVREAERKRKAKDVEDICNRLSEVGITAAHGGGGNISLSPAEALNIVDRLTRTPF